ncbi:MAG: hypothetical protein MZV70_36240 [Desulfobacterales bacterium]|nr:hypothetical protein [Desulfobacterales bacterium]
MKGDRTLTVTGVSTSSEGLATLSARQGERKVMRTRELWDQGWRPIEQTGVYRAKETPVPVAEKSDVQLRKELAARYYANSGKMPSKESLDKAVQSIRGSKQGFPERGPEKTREEELLESDVEEARKPEPAKPKFKPGETIQDSEGETWWGPLRDGGVPAEFEALKEGDIWVRQGKGKQPRAKISKVDSELPWNAEVLYQGDAAVVNTNVYDLWARGFRPKGFKGGDTIGRTEVPRPAQSVMGPEDDGVVERPLGAPKRGSNVVLDKQQKLEAARATERILRARRQAKAGIPAEEPTPEPERGGTIRKGAGFHLQEFVASRQPPRKRAKT